MSKPILYYKEDLNRLKGDGKDCSKEVFRYFTGMIEEGAKKYIANIESTLALLQIDDIYLPLTINESEYGNSYVTSMYAVLPYSEEEMVRYKKNALRMFLKPFFLVLSRFLKKTEVNQIVIVNNFLLSTNLYDQLTEEQIGSLLQFLKKTFPTHAICFRSVNPYTDPRFADALKKRGAHLITSRSVYIFDPIHFQKIGSKARWNYKKDLSLLNTEGIEVVSHDSIQERDLPQIKNLYDMLYLEKYSFLNPQFTLRFFEKALAEKTFLLTGIRYRGEIVGIAGFFCRGEVMTTPIVGYDTSLPLSLGLYRMIIALTLKHAIDNNLLLNISSGAAGFKRKRGAFQQIEYTGVYHDHLPLRRRLPWMAFELLMNTLGKKTLIRDKL